ncbi:MAG: hypothetical protein Q7S44_02710 [bacterium]|nr:hypothetical protein [bacterium]
MSNPDHENDNHVEDPQKRELIGLVLKTTALGIVLSKIGLAYTTYQTLTSKSPGEGTIPVTSGTTSLAIFNPRRALGVWSKEEVEALAKSMMEESDLNDIAVAGQVLLKNQQREPSFSEFTPLFADTPLEIQTTYQAPTVGTTENPILGGKLMRGGPGSSIREIGNRLEFSLRGREQSTPPLPFAAPTQLELYRIRVPQEDTTFPPLIFKLFMAKEVFNARAYDATSRYLANKLYEFYIPPKDTQQERAVRVATMRGVNGMLPPSFLADIWGHFYLVPNFTKALTEGKIKKENLDLLVIFKDSSDFFLKTGLLQKKDGNYVWDNSNQGGFYQLWENQATNIVDRYFPHLLTR